MEKGTESKGINELVVGTQVLVVEDDEGLNKRIQKSLRRAGFDCFGVLNGADAIERVKKNPKQVLLVDQQLPDMDGTDLVRNLSKHTHDIIFVAMTGHGDEKIAVEMMKLGAKDYLIKGFDLTDILPMVFKRVFFELETEKKLVRAEEALQETNARYSSMMANIGDVIGIMGVDGLMKYKSPNIERWFGWKPEDLVGTDGWETVHPEDIERIQKEFYALLEKENVSTTVEYRYKCKDGTYIWIEMVAANCINDTTINGILLNYHDISDRKQAENDIRLSENLLEEAQRVAHMGHWELDPSIGILVWSDEIFRIFGLNPNEREPSFTKHETYIHPDDWPILERAVEKGSMDGSPFDLVFRIVRSSGEIGWMHAIGTTLISKAGKVIKLFGTAQDITKQKQTENILKDREEQYRAIVDNIGDYIMRYDKEFKHLYANKLAIDLTGLPIDQYIGKTHREMGFPDHLCELWRENIKLVFDTGKQQNIEFDVELADGKMSLALQLNPEFAVDGSVKTVIGRSRDITALKQAEIEKKKLEIQLHQAQKMESIGTLAGGIAHDFNNILFPIVGHTEMLLEDVSKDSPARPSLDQIYTGAMRASELVKQILAFSRQESGELKLMKMQPIIKEALKLIRSTIPTTIEIKQNIQADCGAIKADPTQIHQIVMNLATNAYHAMEETGGELIAGLKQMEFGTRDLSYPDMTLGQYACLTVADTGIGMDKELTQKIFDPFFTTKAIGKGTGMGLSVVHGIVAGMGGAVRVYSEPGKGTEFYVYFPVEKSSFEKQSVQTHETIQYGTETILLVDDEEAIITMEKRMLERLGYQVTSRISSIEALEAFRANPDKFDLVITDMAMPNMPGDKLSAALNKIRPDIPVLLCTGFSETMSEEKAASLGIKGFLLKPIVMKDLSQKIREVLDGNKV